MAIIAAFAICLCTILAYHNLILRERAHLDAATINRLRWQYVHERQRANALKTSRDKLRAQRDEDCAVFEEMQACNVALERRAAWLERRRYLILSRWWRRRAYRSLIVAWRIGRGL